MATQDWPSSKLSRSCRGALDDDRPRARHDAAEPIAVDRCVGSETETRPLMLLFFAALALQTPAAPVSWGPNAPAATRNWPSREADAILKDFRFRDGESLPEVRIHYTTLGAPHRNGAGVIDNAVMVLHGTGGTVKQFLQPQFADDLYGPGKPLYIRRYFIILPDNIGHGGSSK